MDRINQTTDIAKRGRRTTILAFLVFLLYASLRWCVYSSYPVKDFAGWLLRDTVMNAPRLLVLALSLRLGLRVWNRQELGLHARGWRPAAFAFVLFFLVLWLPDAWLRMEPLELSTSALALLAASSIIVGVWEEMLYRGVFFNAIREWKGAKAAVWGSSLLFTVMHIQAQSIAHWPSIFLCGMVFAILRLRGVGLVPLIACHALFDTVVFLGGTGPSLVPGLPFGLFLLRAAFVYQYYRAIRGCFVEDASSSPQHPRETGQGEAAWKAETEATELTPPPKDLTEAQRRHRLRELSFFARHVLEKPESYRIRLHITKVDELGLEKDLGPWPDTVAQTSRLEDATDLCSLLSHHLRGFLHRRSNLL